MVTTIQISDALKDILAKRKLHERETFEDVIFDLIEDVSELSKETKDAILEYEKEVKKNGLKNFKTLEQIKKDLKS